MTARLARNPDRLGLRLATRGQLPARDVQNIVAYARDARAAGYKRYFIVVSPQGTSNPKCKSTEWGGCYDEGFLDASWSALRQIISAVRTADLVGMDVIVDISSESCFVPNSRLRVERNLERYTTFMVKRYRDAFGDRQFIVSCGAANADRVIPQLRALSSFFEDVGARPASVDIHVYETRPDKLRAVLLSAEAAAADLGVPLSIAETYFDHPNIYAAVSGLVSANQLPHLRDLLVFPRLTKSACQIGVRAPYAMNLIERQLNRAQSDGRSLPRCR